MSMCVMEMLEQSPTLLNIASSPSRQILITYITHLAVAQSKVKRHISPNSLNFRP